MKKLFISEWQRLWNRKSTWMSLIIISVMIIAAIKHYIKVDSRITPENIKYVSWLNFPSMLLQNEIIEIFDVIVIMLIIMTVTSEYRTGQLRMVMIRNISFGKIFKAKYLVVLSTAFLFLCANFVLSTFLGYLTLPKQEVKFPYYLRKFTVSKSIFYNIKYYIMAFIILAAVISVIMCISIISKTTIGAVASSFIFIFSSLVLPDLCSVFFSQGSEIYKFLHFSCITRIQYCGIEYLLAQTPQGVGMTLTSVAFHAIVFYLIGFNLFNDKDCYI